MQKPDRGTPGSYVMRPVREDDLAALEALAHLAGFGLSSLPADREYLQEKIRDSLRAFASIRSKPQGENYLFVLEDAATGQVVGTSGILSKVGGFDPFYAYRLETSIQCSPELGVHKEILVLHLFQEHNGPTEICSLFLHPEHQRRGVGRLLSLGRFLFMAEHPAHFEETVIAEMRGVVDEKGRSPFWEALGRHFFDIDYPKADYLSMKNKTFIADLMPRHPIYVNLLPEEAQAVVGKVHEQTRPALKLLQDEGFAVTDLVDIFEAGPVVRCRRERIRTVRASRRAVVSEIAEQTDDARGGATEHLICNSSLCCLAAIGRLRELPDRTVGIDGRTAYRLKVAGGDWIRHAPLRGCR
ncbi:MAG: arginine N-succinyltransferase [bacterium]